MPDLTPDQAISRIRVLAKTLADRSYSEEDLGILGILVGATYAMAVAMEKNFYRRTSLAPNDYEAELIDVLRNASARKVPRSGDWLAGFYFNSALSRISAVHSRCMDRNPLMCAEYIEEHCPHLEKALMDARAIQMNWNGVLSRREIPDRVTGVAVLEDACRLALHFMDAET